jgi:hypothetical protein
MDGDAIFRPAYFGRAYSIANENCPLNARKILDAFSLKDLPNG